MTVSELLARIDSYELSEWVAYERAFGPLGSEWRDETLASVQEQLQMSNWLYGEAHWEDNPIEIEPWPRPAGLLESDDDEDEEEG